MFWILRLIVGALIVTSIYYMKRRISGNVSLGSYLIAAIIIISLLGLIPFENIFYTFDSPEDAYAYASSNAFVLKHVIQGTDSALVIGESDDGEYRIIVSESKNGWKLGIGLSAFPIKNIIFNGYFVQVFHHLGCNDYYIEVYSHVYDYTITDSLNSEFMQVESDYSNSDGTFTTYYAVIPFKDENYTLYIDDTEYYVFQNEGLKDFFNSITSN